MKKKNSVPPGAPKPGSAKGAKAGKANAPIWAPRQSKAPQVRVKPRDTSGKSGQRGK